MSGEVNWFTDDEMRNMLTSYATQGGDFSFDSFDLYSYPTIYSVHVPEDVRIKASRTMIKELLRLEYIEVIPDTGQYEWYRKTPKGKELAGNFHVNIPDKPKPYEKP